MLLQPFPIITVLNFIAILSLRVSIKFKMQKIHLKFAAHLQAGNYTSLQCAYFKNVVVVSHTKFKKKKFYLILRTGYLIVLRLMCEDTQTIQN